MYFYIVELPYNTGSVIKRSTIHDQFGGNRQGGICPSSTYPFIFIFSANTGHKYGYTDDWDNEDIFSYTGEGQVGDMDFVRGNLALRDHIESGKRVFLFKYVRKAYVRFEGEMEFYDYDLFETPDRNGTDRLGIKFFFKRSGAVIEVGPEDLKIVADPLSQYSKETSRIIIPNSTERAGLVTSRVGQGAYRKSILHRWRYKCAVTKFSQPKVLIASHILPWKDAKDEQRMDIENGILLSPNYDALFDKNFISFEDSGKIILSDKTSINEYGKLGITGRERISNLTTGNKEYLDFHRSKLLLA